MPQSPDRALENQNPELKIPAVALPQPFPDVTVTAEDIERGKQQDRADIEAQQRTNIKPLEIDDGPDTLSGEALLSMDLRHATGGQADWSKYQGVVGSGLVYSIPQSAEEAVLAMQYRPGDDAYNRGLDNAKAQIKFQRGERGQQPTQETTAKEYAGYTDKYKSDRERDTQEQADLKQMAEDDKRRRYVADRPLIYSATGEAVPVGMEPSEEFDNQTRNLDKRNPNYIGPDAENPDGSPNEKQRAKYRKGSRTPQAAVGVTKESGGTVTRDPKKLVRNGGFVYGGAQEEMYGGRAYVRDVYIHKDQAQYEPQKWSAEQVAAFQASQKIPVTGVADQKTRDAWKEILETSEMYVKAGVNMDLGLIMQAQAATKKSSSSGGAGGRGGGGGGGGGGSVLVPVDTAKALLNKVARETLGREATDAEQAAFYPAIVAAASTGDFDANQFTLSWLRGQRGTEAGSYQVATDYYQTLMSTLGAGS